MPSSRAPANVAPTDPEPPLSTLVLPNYEMGQKAAETLIDMAIHGKTLRPMTIKVDGPLVVRTSTAKTKP